MCKNIMVIAAFWAMPIYTTAQCWKEVATTSLSTALLKSDGTIWTTGNNSFGRLGDGNAVMGYPIDAFKRDYFAPISNDTNWEHIYGAWEHMFAIRKDKTLWAWGRNKYGELGVGDTTNRNIPTKVNNDTDWTWVSGGGIHTLALKSNGTLWAWGDGGFGELGMGASFFGTNIPLQVGIDTDWVHCEGGGYCSWALKSDGTIWAWGANETYRLGLGFINPIGVYTPTKLVDSDWVSFSASGGYLLAIKQNGTLWGAGQNPYGNLIGIGNKMLPTLMDSSNNWVMAVSGGSPHTICMKSDSSVWVCGGNADGELGFIDTCVACRFFQSKYSLFNVKQISAKGRYTMVLKDGGEVLAFGENYDGQLGNGNTSTPFPTQVAMQGCWPTGLPPAPSLTRDNVVIYPNPASDIVVITGDDNFRSVKIYTMMSQLVFEVKIRSSKRLEIDLSYFPAGVYLVNIDGKYIRKLVVEK